MPLTPLVRVFRGGPRSDAKSAGYSLWRSASRSSAVRFASRACCLSACNCFRLLLCTAEPFKFGGLTLRLR
jgi:hypothetical protein